MMRIGCWERQWFGVGGIWIKWIKLLKSCVIGASHVSSVSLCFHVCKLSINNTGCRWVKVRGEMRGVTGLRRTRCFLRQSYCQSWATGGAEINLPTSQSKQMSPRNAFKSWRRWSRDWDWDPPLNFDFSNPVAIEMKFVNFLSLGGWGIWFCTLPLPCSSWEPSEFPKGLSLEPWGG